MFAEMISESYGYGTGRTIETESICEELKDITLENAEPIPLSMSFNEFSLESIYENAFQMQNIQITYRAPTGSTDSSNPEREDPDHRPIQGI